MDNPLESYVVPGRNNRFTEIAASMGLSQLRCLPQFLAARRRVAAIYDELLLKSEVFVPLLANGESRPSYWRYVVMPTLKVNRNELQARLREDKISIDWAYDPPLHLQPVFKTTLGTHEGMLPKSEAILSQHICLPVHAQMRDIDCEYVVERLLHHVKAMANLKPQT